MFQAIRREEVLRARCIVRSRQGHWGHQWKKAYDDTTGLSIKPCSFAINRAHHKGVSLRKYVECAKCGFVLPQLGEQQLPLASQPWRGEGDRECQADEAQKRMEYFTEGERLKTQDGLNRLNTLNLQVKRARADCR